MNELLQTIEFDIEQEATRQRAFNLLRSQETKFERSYLSESPNLKRDEKNLGVLYKIIMNK